MKRTELRRTPLPATARVGPPPIRTRRRDTGPSKRVRELVKARDGGCMVCGDQTVDLQHRRARGMGGAKDPAANKPSNLVCLCRPHHELVETDPWWMARGAEKGWRVSQSRDPRLVRCWVRDAGPMFLLDDGSVTYSPYVAQGATP